MLRRTQRSTLFPYTTLFRSNGDRNGATNSSKLLQDCAGSFSPEAELTTPQTIIFDVSRLHRLYRSANQIGEAIARHRSEEHTSELQSLTNLVCRLLLEKKKQ